MILNIDKVCLPALPPDLSQLEGTAHGRPQMKRPLQNNAPTHDLGATGRERPLLEVPKHNPDTCPLSERGAKKATCGWANENN